MGFPKELEPIEEIDLHFQFPLWDSFINSDSIVPFSVNFQFPLWDSVGSSVVVGGGGFTLSIPFMGFSGTRN